MHNECRNSESPSVYGCYSTYMGQCSPGYLEETMEYFQTEKPPWSQ